MKVKTVFAFSCLLILPRFAFFEGNGIAQKPVRVEKGPALDGNLQDEDWKQAAPFTGFKMVFPNPGMEPSERTELRIIVDVANLSIGISCNDSDPSKKSGNSMAHDGVGRREADDVVRVLLDPFHDKISKSRFDERNGSGVEAATGPYSIGLGAAAVTSLIRVNNRWLDVTASRYRTGV